MSLCLLEFSSISFITGLGSSSSPLNFWEWKGSCKACGKVVKGIQGIFCANFGCCQGNWMLCQKAWYGKCYKAHPKDDFHVHLPQDEEGFVWRKRGDKNHFACGRNGDHLVTPFQCDLCIFQVLKGHDPIHSSHQDKYLEVLI